MECQVGQDLFVCCNSTWRWIETVHSSSPDWARRGLGNPPLGLGVSGTRGGSFRPYKWIMVLHTSTVRCREESKIVQLCTYKIQNNPYCLILYSGVNMVTSLTSAQSGIKASASASITDDFALSLFQVLPTQALRARAAADNPPIMQHSHSRAHCPDSKDRLIGPPILTLRRVTLGRLSWSYLFLRIPALLPLPLLRTPPSTILSRTESVY